MELPDRGVDGGEVETARERRREFFSKKLRRSVGYESLWWLRYGVQVGNKENCGSGI